MLSLELIQRPKPFATMNKILALSLAIELLLPLPLAAASFDGNLNFASPSRRHASLGIDVPHVSRRSMKRGAVAFAPEELDFTHGVASGDPYADSVVLWTRVAPSLDSDRSNVTVEGPVPLYSHETQTYIDADASPVCVEWKVWLNETGDEGVVAAGDAYTTSDIDYTVKVIIAEFFSLGWGCGLIGCRSRLRGCSRLPRITTSLPSAGRARRVPLDERRLRRWQMLMFRS